MRRVRVTGTGKYLPKRKVSAEAMDAFMGAEPGWTLAHTGVAVRHFVEDETASFMGAEAARWALLRAKRELKDIDLILGASATMEQLLPATATLLQRELGGGASGIPSFDVNATCMSFVVALDMASTLIASGAYRRILIISSEVASVGINPAEKESCALFGDGAAAAVLEAVEGDANAMSASGVLASRIETYSDGVFDAHIPGGGTRHYPTQPGFDANQTYFQMSGPKIFARAARVLPAFFERLFADLPFQLRECKLIIPHQASLSALELTRRRLELAPEQFAVWVQDHGNQIAASVPTGLHNAIIEGRIQRGDVVCLCGTASGFTVAGVVLRF